MAFLSISYKMFSEENAAEEDLTCMYMALDWCNNQSLLSTIEQQEIRHTLENYAVQNAGSPMQILWTYVN